MKMKDILKNEWLLVIIILVCVIFLVEEPAQTYRSLVNGLGALTEFIIILLPIFLLVGLFGVWVDEKKIRKYLGEPGIKNFLFGAILGTIYSGPIISLYPILDALLKKGARPAVAMTVISTFAIKVPLIPLEVKFLGVPFTLVHNLLILVLAPMVGILIEKLVILEGYEIETED